MQDLSFLLFKIVLPKMLHVGLQLKTKLMEGCIFTIYTDLSSVFSSWYPYLHLSVKPARSSQCGINAVQLVRCSNHKHLLLAIILMDNKKCPEFYNL